MIDRALRYGRHRESQFVEPTEIVEKILIPFAPRNPLISLDSDERIQGIPRKTNSRFRVFSWRNG
jgi:hypothetical protein